MDYYGDVVEVNEKYKVVGIGEVGISSTSEPILVTSAIQTCVAILLITKECALMVHVNLEDKTDYAKALNDLGKLLKEHNSNIDKLQIFTGPGTKDDGLEDLKSLLNTEEINVEVYGSYFDNCYGVGQGGIAYDFNQNKYYGIDSDGCFRDYVLGANNKRKDLLDEYNENGYVEKAQLQK